jgi:hypothetical protein
VERDQDRHTLPCAEATTLLSYFQCKFWADWHPRRGGRVHHFAE